jgi:hypothetical protein
MTKLAITGHSKICSIIRVALLFLLCLFPVQAHLSANEASQGSAAYNCDDHYDFRRVLIEQNQSVEILKLVHFGKKSTAKASNGE